MLNAVVRVRFAFNRTNFVLGVMTLCDYLRFGFRCIFFTVSLCYSDVINMRFINAIARNSLVALRPCVWFSIVLVPQHTFISTFFCFLFLDMNICECVFRLLKGYVIYMCGDIVHKQNEPNGKHRKKIMWIDYRVESTSNTFTVVNSSSLT